ncbi:hypothetical protein PCANC_17273 [Puccinia coronata f. sp. avenae]|nr:hypothetical protein PCANC_18143 [Puccinia coronata f. sp. avenae]PLW32584.1 hypothetical protein PCANC_17273 [Puccinia coronata f. sp. avenae]
MILDELRINFHCRSRGYIEKVFASGLKVTPAHISSIVAVCQLLDRLATLITHPNNLAENDFKTASDKLNASLMP